jgi:hypothetical protein
MARKAHSAPAFVQEAQPEAASGKGHSSFPQAFPFVSQVDSTNANKIQDVVVFC